ncbi:MAG: serine/threonine-protein kinase [Rhodobacterales bacterium]|nr:serine/threonine-protein kinase [Rhodobacterales bacterium]
MANPTSPDHMDETYAEELAPGQTLLQGQYRIESYLNAGGFGITYLARDSLNRRVVIKECFPGALCHRSATRVRAKSRASADEFRSLVALFLREARNLAKLDHPNIVGVHQVFEDNDTAYMALDLVPGSDLLDIIEGKGIPLDPPRVQAILLRLLDAIGYMHDQNILHRDISPDNILVTAKGEPILIDFGSAREDAHRATRVLTGMLMVKDGYSPQEFYIANSRQFPCSDLYALGATFYHAVSGRAPPDSQTRIAALATGQPDPCLPLAGRLDAYDPAFLATIDRAMSVLPGDRVQSASEWACLIDPSRRQAAFVADAERTRHIELTIARLITESSHLPTPEPEAKAPVPLAEPPAPRVIEYIGFDEEEDDEIHEPADPPDDNPALDDPWPATPEPEITKTIRPTRPSTQRLAEPDRAAQVRCFDWSPPPPEPSITSRTARFAIAGLLIGGVIGYLAPFAQNAVSLMVATPSSAIPDEGQG